MAYVLLVEEIYPPIFSYSSIIFLWLLHTTYV